LIDHNSLADIRYYYRIQ